jgi:hypothetical protein
MHLDVGGHPLHTRALGITLSARDDGRIDARGSIIDLRKRGFVPVGGDLQPSGIVHHMTLDAIVDPATARLDTVTAAQPNVAFEASAVPGGESCRDPIANVQGLAGARCDAGWARRRAARLLASSRSQVLVRGWASTRAASRRRRPPPWRARVPPRHPHRRQPPCRRVSRSSPNCRSDVRAGEVARPMQRLRTARGARVRADVEVAS